jgi:NAD-specific glutamate dehydrogenase
LRAGRSGRRPDLADDGILRQIPSRGALLASDQKKRGLPRPLLCDLLGYTKMWGSDGIMGGDLPDSEVALPYLQGYFPKRLHKDFSAILRSIRCGGDHSDWGH